MTFFSVQSSVKSNVYSCLGNETKKSAIYKKYIFVLNYVNSLNFYSTDHTIYLGEKKKQHTYVLEILHRDNLALI